MNRALAETIVQCLSVARDPTPALFRLGRFSERDWVRTREWLDLSGLALHLCQRLEECRAEPLVPARVAKRLQKNLADNRQRLAAIAADFVRLNGLLAEAGIAHAALKGLAMVPDYCPDGVLRVQFDHDYLVEAESLARAEETLQAAGYTRKNPHEAHPRAYIRSSSERSSLEKRTDFYSAELIRPVELHVRLWEDEEEGIPIDLPRDFLERAQLLKWSGHRYGGLSDEDALLFQVLHGFRHMLRNWCRLSILLEIASFLRCRAQDERLWQSFGERTKNLRYVPQAAGVVFSLATQVFDGEVPAAARPFTVETLTPALKLWVERYGTRLALDNFRKTKFSLFLHREFVSDGATWRAMLRRRLFPRHTRAITRTLPAWKFAALGPQSLRQAAYALQRLGFHLVAALTYGWEHSRWVRLRKKVYARSVQYVRRQEETDRRSGAIKEMVSSPS
ncbi:MAG: nucleotidyltransferase family protein [Acidobacteriia bacterium]|nr:nucleotidyltransferase family protein [Terriglobia bacterium]